MEAGFSCNHPLAVAVKIPGMVILAEMDENFEQWFVRLGIERRHVVCAGAHLQEGARSFSHGRADARWSDESR